MIRLFVFLFLFVELLFSAKVKDISQVVGVRDNQLIGYGLIVGLTGTGDGSSSIFTLRSLSNMLESVNVKVSPEDIKSKNVAAVMVTAKLPPFARQGDKLDIVVSSIGDAKSIEGGTLLLTPLKGVDGEIYALAQGPVSIGGRNQGGGKVQNHTTAGAMYGGAIVEREIIYDIYNKESTLLSLKESNFANAVAIQKSLNNFFDDKVAIAIDPRTVRVSKPKNISMVEFLAQLQDIDIEYSKKDKIVIDERTGTIVAGIDITIEPVVISHGDITIKITPDSSVSDAIENQKDNGVDMSDFIIGQKSNIIESKKPTVASLARALQKLGAVPKDIISILEAMKKAGAISVDLEII
ncbi:MAG: flagellar basal body P-ring protein FlgI [Campylobacterales bacterium]|nr:flagellar basal body P-ring protein FlgI [Campylobacterales bacterium]